MAPDKSETKQGAHAGVTGATAPEAVAAQAAGRTVTTTHEEALEAGYLGAVTDPRPNEHYAIGNEETRRAMVAEGKAPDRPPDAEQVGPARKVGDDLRELSQEAARKRAGKAPIGS